MVIRILGGRVGGAERLFCELASMLAERGDEVTVLHCDTSAKPIPYPLSPKVTRINLLATQARDSSWYKKLDEWAVRYEESGQSPWYAPVDWLAKNLYFLRRLHAVARDCRPDVIISFLPPANTPSLLAGLLTGTKVVPTNHSVPAEDYTTRERWDQNPIDRALRSWSLHAAERIHVLFPAYTDFFPRRLRDRVVAIPNYVSPEFLAAEPAGPRRKEIVAVGRLNDIKNYRVLIDAWSQLAERHPDWRVSIYGSGPQRKELGGRIQELGLEGVVTLKGQQTGLRRVYQEAEIFCHPARFEGFGLSVVEALADSKGVEEIVKDGDNGLLAGPNGDPTALAAVLERMISDVPLRQRMQARAPESVRGFTQQAFLDRWLDLLDDIGAGGEP
jgi:glycosyltransferase involved in cell wall biosynthesis